MVFAFKALLPLLNRIYLHSKVVFTSLLSLHMDYLVTQSDVMGSLHRTAVDTIQE